MSSQAKELTERFKAFNNEIIAFVEKCSDEEWKKICPGEELPIGVVASHVAKRHYGAFDWAKMIVAGEKLPEITKAANEQANAELAEAHKNCTKREVLGFLHEDGSTGADYLGGLEDSDLDRIGYFALTGGEISTKQMVEKIIIQRGNDHLSSMKKAIA
jgi:hypothetical protein